MQYVCERKHFNKRLFKVGTVVTTDFKESRETGITFIQEEQLPKGKDGKIMFFRPFGEVKEEIGTEKGDDLKCEWCERVLKSKAGKIAHQRICNMNPDLIGLAR